MLLLNEYFPNPKIVTEDPIWWSFWSICCYFL